MKRTYYRFSLTLCSPLSLGSGIGDNTDSDVLVDSRGVPFIPATSIAGVIRHSIADQKTADKLFGSIDGEGNNTQIIIYDALCGGAFTVTIRDSVSLKEKVAEDTGKFDFEAVETGAEFVGYIELLDDADADEIILEALAKIDLGLLRFGHKTTRGYGAVKITECQKLVFTDVNKWLEFDMFDGDCWNGAENIALNSESGAVKITLKLKQRGGLSIRSYTTEAANGGEKAPDYEQLSLKSGVPVIPGTSWAGAFRERFQEFAGEEACKNLFGYIVKNQSNGGGRKSRIYFGESRIEKYETKLITRNSIDRYTSGTNDGALYTERTVFNGETELEIIITEKQSVEVLTALAAVIADLDNGFLAVGGLTAVGRGIFSVENMVVNGKDVTKDLKARQVKEIAEVIGHV